MALVTAHAFDKCWPLGHHLSEAWAECNVVIVEEENGDTNKHLNASERQMNATKIGEELGTNTEMCTIYENTVIEMFTVNLVHQAAK